MKAAIEPTGRKVSRSVATESVLRALLNLAPTKEEVRHAVDRLAAGIADGVEATELASNLAVLGADLSLAANDASNAIVQKFVRTAQSIDGGSF